MLFQESLVCTSRLYMRLKRWGRGQNVRQDAPDGTRRFLDRLVAVSSDVNDKEVGRRNVPSRVKKADGRGKLHLNRTSVVGIRPREMKTVMLFMIHGGGGSSSFK